MFFSMFDKTKLYAQVPKEIKIDGLIKVLTDINGNEFNADNYDKGFEMMIDYPQAKNEPLMVMDYRVCVNESGKKFWGLNRKRHWVKDLKLSHCGSWVEGLD